MIHLNIVSYFQENHEEIFILYFQFIIIHYRCFFCKSNENLIGEKIKMPFRFRVSESEFELHDVLPVVNLVLCHNNYISTQ